MTTSQTTSSAYDSKDVDDAAQVIGRLIESHTKQREDAAQAGQPSASDLELWQEIAPVLADFNREIEDEAHGRKERFRTQRLIKNREQLTGEAVDEELDFLEEDDNIVAVFEHEDGSLYWVVGSIQYVCTTDVRHRHPQNFRRRFAGAPLALVARSCMRRALTVVDWCGAQRLDKQDHKRISIDDPRAVFLVAWYVEVDKHGKDLPGYQNRACAGYRMPVLDNTEPYRWISNYQVISAVEMMRHPMLPRKIWQIRAAELKTVTKKFADMAMPQPAPAGRAGQKRWQSRAPQTEQGDTESDEGEDEPAAATRAQHEAAAAAAATAAQKAREAAQNASREERRQARELASAAS